MDKSQLTAIAVPAVLLFLFFSLMLGQVLGQPILLAYVETGSMAPTMEPGDGFIAVPMFVAGPVEPGDVITFNAKELHGGGLVTHRVVRETPEGFITQGDANPVTDQDGAEPPVQRSQIKAKGLQIGDQLVVIPKIGLVIITIGGVMSGIQQGLSGALGLSLGGGSQTISYVMFGIGILSYIVFTFSEDGQERKRTRDTKRRSDVINAGLLSAVLTLLLVGIITASMVIPAGAQDFNFVSAENDAPGSDVIKQGTTEQVEYIVPGSGPFPTLVFLEPASEGIRISPKEVYVPGFGQEKTAVTLEAPSEIGPTTRTLTEHRYLAIAPRSTIKALYNIHPWLPILYIDSIIGIGFELLAFVLIGTGQQRMRSRSTSRSS